MPPSGFNAHNESFTGNSFGVDVSYYDQNGDEIPITDPTEPIGMSIPHYTGMTKVPYLFVNTTNMTIESSQQILPNGVNLTATNASLSLQLFPANLSVGYLVLFNKGSTPILNATTSNYTSWYILCPNSSDFITVSTADYTDSFFYMFLSQPLMNGYKGKMNPFNTINPKRVDNVIIWFRFCWLWFKRVDYANRNPAIL